MFGSLVTLLGAALALHDPSPKSYVLIVSGLGGDSAYSQDFYAAGRRLATAMRVRQGVPDSMIMFLAENPSPDSMHIQGPPTKAEVEKAFARITAKVAPGDVVFVVLIGHGANQDGVSRFNLRGPDMSAEDFGKLLQPLDKQRVVFVNGASASGEYVKVLSGKSRVIITANKTPAERNHVRFGKWFAAAYDDSTAGTKGRVSVLEAFQRTCEGIEREYKANGEVKTETAVLDDNGDGEGTDAPTHETPDGPVAAGLFVTTEKSQ